MTKRGEYDIMLDIVQSQTIILLENIMKSWNTPSATEMRFGFEVTMYVMNK